jgi:hypothetical protein
MKKLLMFLLLILSATFAEAKRHPHLKKYSVLLPPSHQSLILQNQMADSLGLERIANEQRLSELVSNGKLVALPNISAVRIAQSLPCNRRYVLLTTYGFLVKLSSEYYAEFGLSLQIDSAVRPRDVQGKLRRVNLSAAPVDGETASSHETGATIDISRSMNKKQTRWLELRLWYYQAIGRVLVEEETHCFHVMVVRGNTE